MFKKIYESLFGLTPLQEETYNLVVSALSAKNYTVKESRIAYYDGDSWLALTVLIELKPDLTIYFSRSLDHYSFGIKSNETDKIHWTQEIGSRKTKNLIVDHFHNILIQEKNAKQQKIEDEKQSALNKLTGSLQKRQIKEKMNKEF